MIRAGELGYLGDEFLVIQYQVVSPEIIYIQVLLNGLIRFVY